MKNISISSKLFCLTIFVILFSFEPAFSQKLKSGRVAFRYKSYPAEPLPSYIKNYYIEFSGEGAKNQVLTNQIKETLKFGNLKQVEDKEAGNLLLVHLIINKMTDKSELLRSKVEKIKSRVQGQEDKEITKYYYEVNYKMPIEIRLKLHGNKTFKMPPSKILRSRRTFNTTSYEKSQLDYYYRNPPELDHYRNVNAIEVLQKEFDKYFKYYDHGISAIIFSAKRKKDKYPELKDAFKLSKEIMRGVVDVRTNEKQKTEMKKIAQVWEDALLNADTTDEKSRINKEIYYGLMANLTFAYIVTEQFEKAQKFYNSLLAHNSKLLDMKDAVNALTKLFSLYHGSYNRMFPDFDLDKMLPGEWEIVAITTDQAVDYNKNGTKSKNLFEQYDRCEKHQVFKFFDTKKLTTIQGNEKDGCKPKVDDELFWATKYHKTSGWKSFFIGDEENFELNEFEAKQFKVISAWYNGLTLLGYTSNPDAGYFLFKMTLKKVR